MSYSFKRNKNAARKQSFLENINVPCRFGLQITKSCVYALKLPIEAEDSILKHGIESCFECLTTPRKQVQDCSKEFLPNKNTTNNNNNNKNNNNNNNNNNKKISWKSHQSQ